MKRFSLLLFSLMIGTLAIGQIAPGPFLKQNTQVSQDISQSQLYQQRMDMRANNHQRSIRTFDLAYFIADINYTAVTGGQPTFSTWDLNRDYTVTCPPVVPADTVNNFTVRWAAVVFDRIYDDQTAQTFDLATSTITVDSAVFEFNHTNVSGSDDTVVIHIMEIANTGSGLASANAGIKINNDTLWTDTIITNQSLGQGVAALPVGVQVPAGEGYVMLIEYFGPEEDVFTLNNYFRDDCSNACFAAPSLFPNNSFQYLNLDFPLAGGGCNSLSGLGNLVVDCNQNGAQEPELCEEYVLQNWGMLTVITVDAPFFLNAEASETSACPTESILLRSNINSGVPPFSVTWSDINGQQTGIQNPFNDSTNVTLPTCGSYPCTVQYIVEISDNGGDTARDTVTITLNGIDVDAGADVTVQCGQLGTLTATVSGVTQGGVNISWSNSAVGTTADSLPAGTYTVVVSNSTTGCTSSDAATVNITGVSQVPSFTVASADPTHGTTPCVTELVTFTNTSTELTGWDWEWDLRNDGTFSTAESPVIAYSIPGPYTVTLKASQQSNPACQLTSAPTDIVVRDANHPQCVVGVEEFDANGAISVYPNPSNGYITVNFKDVVGDNITITVLDITGKAVYNEANISTASDNFRSIDLSNNPNGIYFLRITTEEETYGGKLTVTK